MKRAGPRRRRPDDGGRGPATPSTSTSRRHHQRRRRTRPRRRATRTTAARGWPEPAATPAMPSKRRRRGASTRSVRRRQRRQRRRLARRQTERRLRPRRHRRGRRGHHGAHRSRRRRPDSGDDWGAPSREASSSTAPAARTSGEIHTRRLGRRGACPRRRPSPLDAAVAAARGHRRLGQRGGRADGRRGQASADTDSDRRLDESAVEARLSGLPTTTSRGRAGGKQEVRSRRGAFTAYRCQYRRYRPLSPPLQLRRGIYRRRRLLLEVVVLRILCALLRCTKYRGPSYFPAAR